MKRTPINPKPKKLLIQRNAAAAMLDCHPRTLIRKEADGELKPVKLSKGGRTFYRLADIEAMAGL